VEEQAATKTTSSSIYKSKRGKASGQGRKEKVQAHKEKEEGKGRGDRKEKKTKREAGNDAEETRQRDLRVARRRTACRNEI